MLRFTLALIVTMTSTLDAQASSKPEPERFHAAIELARSARQLRCAFDTSYVSVLNNGTWSSSANPNDRESAFTMTIDKLGAVRVEYDQGSEEKMRSRAHQMGIEISSDRPIATDIGGVPIGIETKFVVFGYPQSQTNPKRLPLTSLEFSYMGVSAVVSTKRVGSCVVLSQQ